jgi:glutamyl-tRNA synthetase
MEFLFTPDDELEIDPASWEKLTKVERVADVLDAVIAFVETCEWTREIDPRPAIDALGIKPGKVMHVLYTAIEGRSQGLPLFDSISLLRRESALIRLRAARARL